MPQSPTVAAPQRWPLHAPLQSRTTVQPFAKDARLYNGYAELDPVMKEYQIFKRQGLGSPVVSLPPATGNGIYTETGSALVNFVLGGTLYGFANGVATVIGNVDNSAPYFFETVSPFNGLGSGGAIILSNGLNTYTYRYISRLPPYGGIQSDPPPATTAIVPNIVSLNTFIYAMDLLGNIWGGTTTGGPAVVNWNALNVIEADNETDLGVGLIKQLNYIIAFKQYSTQVFYDAGNPPPGSSLAPAQDYQIPLGCLAGNTIQSIDNSVLWVTANQTASPQVVQMDSLVPRVVSTPAVDRFLQNISWNSPVTDVRSWVLKNAGHRLYGITSIVSNYTLVYDLDQQLWYIWTDPSGNFWPIVGMAFQFPQGTLPGMHLAQHLSNGNIYPVDEANNFPNDNGVLFPVDIYTPNFDGGVNRYKLLSNMYFNSDQQNGSILNVRFSDDDYQSWSNFRNVDLSERRPHLADCGSFRRRAYHYRHLCNTPLRLSSVDLQIDLGTL